MKKFDYLQYYGIQASVHDREMEHILQCELCYVLFPLYYHHPPQSQDPLTTWLQSTEQQRESWLKRCTKTHDVFLRTFLKQQHTSGYQMFVAMHSKDTQLPMPESTKKLAEAWNRMTEPERQPYVWESERHNREAQLQFERLPRAFQDEIQTLKKERKASRVKRLPSAFVLFSNDKWREAKQMQQDYRQFQKQVSELWKQAPERVRKQYFDIADEMRAKQLQELALEDGYMDTDDES